MKVHTGTKSEQLEFPLLQLETGSALLRGALERVIVNNKQISPSLVNF